MSDPYTIHTGDCLQIMAGMDADSVDTIITDPPYGLEFMGKDWDHGVPGVPYWQAAKRVAKPGAFLMAFGGTRTFHRLTCAIEDAGWEIRDCVMWVYGSGFPKSLDVSKAIDKAAGAEREVVGQAKWENGRNFSHMGNGTYQPAHDKRHTADITAPATEAAQTWEGYGTALKPAWEPIIIARKPLDGTVAANVLEHGTGALNIDGCRIETEEGDYDHPGNSGISDSSQIYGDYAHRNQATPHSLGRWPANLILDGSDEVEALFPETGPSVSAARGGTNPNPMDWGKARDDGRRVAGHDDNGGSAARFFYCAKASKEDRNKGLDGTCTVKHIVLKSTTGGLSCKDASTVLVQLLRKVTSESITKWSIGECGESITGRCQRAYLSTTLTAIKEITESKILGFLTPSLIRDCIADVNYETENGGSHAASAVSSNQSKITTTSELRELVRGVKPAALSMLSTISDGENWNPLSNFHATVKPTALMQYLCRLTKAPEGGVVLDPFMGSGSTGIAALKDERRFIGIELDAEYVELAHRRIRESVGELALMMMEEKENSGLTDEGEG